MTDPIRTRLDKLHNQWVAFADDPHARLLIWRARQDERAMVDAFIGRECDPERAETPDLFLQLVAPWGPAHGARLAAELVEQAAEAELDWQWSKTGDDIAALLSALGSLRARLGERMLAVWLEPPPFDDGYLLWLQRLAHAAPEGIRFVVVGDGYEALAKASPERVREVPCALDMPAAFEALTNRAGDATPDDLFRRLQAQLNARLAANDWPGAQESAERAIALANEQKWPQLACAVQLVMGAALAARADHVAAVAAYREAERQALQCSELRIAKQLRLFALLGSGGALFVARAFGPAADVYLRAAAAAEELEDLRSSLDAYRMASACSAELGDRERAWDVGLKGLRAGARMNAAERETSTLPDLAAQLQRWFAGDARADALQRQMARLDEA
jgi:hypothetical protein